MQKFCRYGRWLKRIALFLMAYVVIACFFMGVSPSEAITPVPPWLGTRGS